MFTEQVIEIDLYTRLRQERSFVRYGELEELLVLIPHIGKSIVLPLTNTRQRYGRRMSFICRHCNHRVQKLYVQVWQFNTGRWAVACRRCHQLKYTSQYRKDQISKREASEYKLKRLESQKRRYWYGDEHTQFGVRYQKLRNETKTFLEIMAEAYRTDPNLLPPDLRRRMGV